MSPTSIDPIQKLNDEKGNPILQLRWREDSAREADKLNIKNVNPIGSPFLYALSNLGYTQIEMSNLISKSVGNFDWPRENIEQHRYLSELKKILYMPLHTWDGDVHVHQLPDDSPLFGLKNSKVTALLGFLDFCDPNVRNYYIEMGWNVECAGVRSSKITGSPAGSRNKFLYNLHEIMSKHEIIVSNEFTTGLYYAASIGKKIGILNQSSSHELKYSSWQDRPHFEKRMKLIRDHYDWLIGGSERGAFSDTVEVALGLRSMRSPEYFRDNIEILEFRSYGENKVL